MPTSHTIRLRHPWQCETTSDGALWSRKFNWPAEVEPGESISLLIQPVAQARAITLNGKSLPTGSTKPLDITGLIAVHNSLTINCAESTGVESGACPFEVRLEILPNTE